MPLTDVYIDANFKETQLARLLPGQPVAIKVDALPGETIEGAVESVAPASGSVFSLLPPDNATGNFTKIVQRLPVRIRVPADVAGAGALRPGMSVVVDVDTKRGAVADRSRRERRRTLPTSELSPSSQERAIGHAGPAAGAPNASTPRGFSPSWRCASACSWRSSTSRSSRPRSPKSRPASPPPSDEIPWVQTAYLIAEVIAIPLSGFLSRALGTRCCSRSRRRASPSRA